MRDSLDNLHFGSGGQEKWHSTASYCQTSGTILHFLSLSTNNNNNDNNQDKDNMAPLQLISINGLRSIADCRQSLANVIQSKQYIIETRLRGITFNLMNKLGKHLTPAWILADNPTTSHVSPILDLTNHSTTLTESENNYRHENIGKLRELVLPFFPEDSSLQSKLSKSSLTRPLPGLYQCSVDSTDESKDTMVNNGLIFRPLPAAEEDLTLSKPSLVFQCQHLTDSQKKIQEKGGKTHKIGWKGHGKLGSLMVRHQSLSGLDIRLVQSTTDDWIPTAAFDESTESLLAGSLDDLQSSHVNSDGNVSDNSLVKDEKIGNGDCWIEVRSNVQQPLGFIKQFKSQKKQTIAKPPDLPFE